MLWLLNAAVACTLAAALAVAGLGKLAGPQRWRAVLDRSGLPHVVLRPVAVAVPWAEIGMSALLVSGVRPVAAGLAAAVLFVGFACAEGLLIVRGRTADCGCYGPLHDRPASWAGVGSTCVLAGMALVRAAIAARAPVPASVRVVIVVLAAAAAAWLVCRTWTRRREELRLERRRAAARDRIIAAAGPSALD